MTKTCPYGRSSRRHFNSSIFSLSAKLVGSSGIDCRIRDCVLIVLGMLLEIVAGGGL